MRRVTACVLLLVSAAAQAQQSSDPSRFDFYSIRLYMKADEVLYHMEQMKQSMGGRIYTDEQASVFVPKKHYTRSVVWETDRFTLIADLLQHRKKGKVSASVVGMSLHPKFATRMEAQGWFQANAPRFGPATFASKVGPDAENSLYFCHTVDGRSCEAQEPLLILGHNYMLMSDCGYVDRVGEPMPVEMARK
ncbi:hypothetical protein [Granulicella pectinivorans]|uniref:hypothetical protein n=1 Tax=Granulicella pectinivorans TaxID=474950 RepID=UPI0015876DEF|nr:hypothetical protein [Granulicella pectinivorans]